MINFKDWAELDGPTIVLVIGMMFRDTIREYLRARYGAPPPPPPDSGTIASGSESRRPH